MSHGKQALIVVVFIAGVLGFAAMSARSYPPLDESLGSELTDRRGRTVDTSSLARKDHVLLYFSASWCPPCQKFTPELVRFYDAHAKTENFEIILVPADRSRDAMMAYMKKHRMPFPALPFDKYGNRQRVQELYGARGIPHLVLLDAKGKVVSTSYDGSSYVGPQKVLADLQNTF